MQLDAQAWKEAIEGAIAACEGRRPPPPPATNLARVTQWCHESTWQLETVGLGFAYSAAALLTLQRLLYKILYKILTSNFSQSESDEC